MKVNEYQVLRDCIEAGINRGWGKAHKHSATPTAEQIKRFIEEGIMFEICEYFNFGVDDE
ncbi:MAG: hypothetical protein RL156_1739 [Bacteroidota bacterium]|jgi:hypothetical protein